MPEKYGTRFICYFGPSDIACRSIFDDSCYCAANGDKFGLSSHSLINPISVFRNPVFTKTIL